MSIVLLILIAILAVAVIAIVGVYQMLKAIDLLSREEMRQLADELHIPPEMLE